MLRVFQPGADRVWALTPERLTDLCREQATILDRAAGMVRSGGWLAYATCSLLRDENEAQIAAFLARHPGWTASFQTRFSPLQGGDGFFVAKLTQSVEISTQP